MIRRTLSPLSTLVVVAEVCRLTFCLLEGLFGSFDSYNDKLINYNVPAEVEKMVNQ